MDNFILIGLTGQIYNMGGEINDIIIENNNVTLYITIPKESWEYDVIEKGESNSEDYASRLKKTYLQLLPNYTTTIKYKEKDIGYVTKERGEEMFKDKYNDIIKWSIILGGNNNV